MKLVWVKGHAPLSKAIMWALNEPVSHFAIVFDNKIVFHSDLMGVRLAWLPSFLKTHEIVFEKDFPGTTLDLEEEVYQSIITKFDGSSYDYKAFLYFTWRALLFKLFKTPIPHKNAWGTNSSFLCTEMAETLPDWIVPPKVSREDLGITSPFGLWKLMSE